jgi:hypothetical protein
VRQLVRGITLQLEQSRMNAQQRSPMFMDYRQVTRTRHPIVPAVLHLPSIMHQHAWGTIVEP